MYPLSYTALLAPAIVLTAVAAVLICAERPALSTRLLGLGVLCLLMLPIRMWESVLMIFAAGLAGTLTRVLLMTIERTKLHAVAANPTVLTVVGILLYGFAVHIPVSRPESFLGVSQMEAAVSAFQWLTLTLLVVIGFPLVCLRIKRGKSRNSTVASRQNEFHSRQFSMIGLLLCVLAISIGCAAVRVAWPQCDYLSSPSYSAVGAICGSGVALFSWLLQLKQPWLVLQLYLLATLLLAPAVDLWIVSLGDEIFGLVFAPWSAVGLVQFMYGFGCLAVAVMSRPLQIRGRLRNPVRVVVVGACFLGFLFSGRLYQRMFRPQVNPVARQPVIGNRYDDVVDLVESVVSADVTTDRTSLLDQISAIAKDDDLIITTRPGGRLASSIRRVNHAFVDDAVRLQSAGDTGAALDRLLTLYLLNCRLSCGGNNCDLLIRHAHNGFPYEMLIGHRRYWNAAQFQEVQHRVAQAAQHAETLSVLNLRDKQDAYISYSWFDGVIDYDIANRRFDGLLCRSLRDDDPWKEIAKIADEERVGFDLLMTDCAINRYALEFGHLPLRLSELVPQYLAVVPIDPFSGCPLRYKVSDQIYVLYSLGQNLVDDGGLPSRFDGDLVIKSIERESS